MPDWVCRVPESTFLRCVKYLSDIALDPVNSACPQLQIFFFPKYHGIYYRFAVKFSILWLLGTWHLVLCPLALLPAYTFSSLQFSFQLATHLITVNIPCAVSGYRHQGVKHQKMNSSFQSKIENMMINREGETNSQGKQHHRWLPLRPQAKQNNFWIGPCG